MNRNCENVFDWKPPSRVDDLARLVEAGGEAVAVQLGPPHAVHVQLDELGRAAADRVDVRSGLQETALEDGAPGWTGHFFSSSLVVSEVRKASSVIPSG